MVRVKLRCWHRWSRGQWRNEGCKNKGKFVLVWEIRLWESFELVWGEFHVSLIGTLWFPGKFMGTNPEFMIRWIQLRKMIFLHVTRVTIANVLYEIESYCSMLLSMLPDIFVSGSLYANSSDTLVINKHVINL